MAGAPALRGAGPEGLAPGFRSVRRRVLLLILAAVVVVTAAFAVASQIVIGHQARREAAEYAGVLVDTVALGVGGGVHQRDPESAVAALRAIASNPAVAEVVIADAGGRIRFSSRPELVGTALARLAYGALEPGHPWTVERGHGRGGTLYRAVPVRTRPECRGCHEGAGETLGTLGVAVALAPADALLGANRVLLGVLLALVVPLILTLNAAVLSRRVIAPLGGLAERLRAAGEGRAAPERAAAGAARDEIETLHAEFERMIAGLRAAQRLEIEKERELAALEVDGRRREELDAVNRELSARLAELDRANERIGGLALQLEGKNASLARAVKNITALNRVGLALSSELDIDRLVRLLINISVKGLRVEIGYIMLMDEQRGQLVMRAWTGLGGEVAPERTLALGESVSGRVAQTGQALLLRHVDGTHGIKGRSRFGFERRSVICAPIRIKERLLGTIELTNKKGGESFSDDDLEMLRSIANQAAVAIENAKLYREIERSYLETIRALVQAVEEKDPYTRGHSERVTTFSLKIGARMALAPRQMQVIQYAGVLHDIGKIGIDIAILQKRDRLTEEEFAVVKNHPIIGERIIRPIGFLADVLPGVSQHHERYDGFGYPLGLTGEKTTIEARILAVADAYDAMITERPYRKPLAKAAAIAELQRCSGTQFDPLVVEHFLEILESDPEIRRLEEQLSAVGT